MTSESEILIHIGPHKTGTTSIQTNLSDNKDHLKARGIHFLDLAHMTGGVHRLADLLSTDRKVEAASYLQELQLSEGKIIISSENFSRLDAEQASSFISHFSGKRIKVVYFLRNPLDRIMSSWKERIKHGYRYTFLEYLSGQLARPFLNADINPAVHLDRWAKAVGKENLDIVNYDTIEDVAKYFSERYLGEALTVEAKSSRINASFDDFYTETLRALSGYQWHLLQHSSFSQEVQRISDKARSLTDFFGKSYERKFQLSMDSGVMSAIERSLIKEYASSDDIQQQHLFEKRSKSFSFVAHEIWMENRAIAEEIFDLREAIHASFGKPKFDQRLYQV